MGAAYHLATTPASDPTGWQAAILSLQGWPQLWPPPMCLKVLELCKFSPVLGNPLPVTESLPGLPPYDRRCSSALSLLSGRKETIGFHGAISLLRDRLQLGGVTHSKVKQFAYSHTAKTTRKVCVHEVLQHRSVLNKCYPLEWPSHIPGSPASAFCGISLVGRSSIF